MERLKTARPAAARRRSSEAPLTTDKRLIGAATALLDSGGEEAVTLRAVAHASGISHNAPYKHFKSRDALLAAVATADFVALTHTFKAVRQRRAKATGKLMQALKVVVDFSVQHPARYRLLFNDPAIAAQKGKLEQTATAAFSEFIAIVKECQAAGTLPDASETTIAGLLFATMHGLIALEANGRMHPEKGLHGVENGLETLIQLLVPR
ncbi:TetR/AcrR family transcriptional regulator [Terriglobus sp.]|uniref:TetR/AcrR family transcriptional regulator n=1 Tax=Terriglobus sp. TaxID=1889013 RepID=UPI003B001A4D